jgi:hypothetical protein
MIMRTLKTLAIAELAFCWLYVMACVEGVIHALVTCNGSVA